MFKLKAIADDKINLTPILNFVLVRVESIVLTPILNFVLVRVENIVGKGENAGYQHFLLFPTMFSKAFFLWVVKGLDLFGKELNSCKTVSMLPRVQDGACRSNTFVICKKMIICIHDLSNVMFENGFQINKELCRTIRRHSMKDEAKAREPFTLDPTELFIPLSLNS